MSDNVIHFPTPDPTPETAYVITIWYVGKDLHWAVDADQGVHADDMASDLAAIALSLQPPRRTFLERLRSLFTGD